jgi:hypothetical protein
VVRVAGGGVISLRCTTSNGACSYNKLPRAKTRQEDCTPGSRYNIDSTASASQGSLPVEGTGALPAASIPPTLEAKAVARIPRDSGYGSFFFGSKPQRCEDLDYLENSNNAPFQELDGFKRY